MSSKNLDWDQRRHTPMNDGKIRRRMPKDGLKTSDQDVSMRMFCQNRCRLPIIFLTKFATLPTRSQLKESFLMASKETDFLRPFFFLFTAV